MTKGTGETVDSVLPGPTRSEAIVEHLRRAASPEATSDEQIEKEFFDKHRPTSLLQRVAKSSEVASLVAYLASPLAAGDKWSLSDARAAFCVRCFNLIGRGRWDPPIRHLSSPTCCPFPK